MAEVGDLESRYRELQCSAIWGLGTFFRYLFLLLVVVKLQDCTVAVGTVPKVGTVRLGTYLATKCTKTRPALSPWASPKWQKRRDCCFHQCFQFEAH